MSFTYGFYNSLNHDRVYDATTMGQLFDGLINDGVYDSIGEKFMVTAAEGMRVNVGSGRAWFNRTWSFNDTVYPIEDEAAEVVLDRIDALVLDINTNVEYRENQIKFVKGTPSSNPVKPTLINSDGHYQYPLAYITVPASSTEIIQDNIENAVGTSECPFANGLLQHVTTDELIVQWQAQWNTWTSDQQVAFINWMNSEEANFADWSSEQQEAFASWMSEEQDDFMDWFEHLQDILDEDVAAHLQAEIDEINANGLLGSIVTITTVEPTLIGKTVSLTGAKSSKSAVFNNEGVAVIRAFEDVGTISVESTDNIRTAVASLTIPYFGDYEVAIAFWAATVNITTTDQALFGETITVEKDGSTVGTCVFNAQGQATYTATEAGNYTFSVTVSGTTYSVSQAVTEEITYNLVIDAGFNYNGWLTAGDVSGTYASLDDVLADEKAVRKLMTKHASVDYLANNNVNEDVEKILNNDLCAKWITRRAYAEDTLTAAYGTLMGTIGKYGYGKWSLMPQVPKMTSNTAPYGEVLAGQTMSSSNPAWKAFDGDNSTYPLCQSGTTDQWLGYDFGKPVKIYTAMIYHGGLGTFSIGYSDDGANWTDDPNTITNIADYTWGTINMSEPSTHRYWRVRKVSSVGPSSGIGNTIQFYAYAPEGNVPVMTSNTAPYGEASANGSYSGSSPYKAFDGANNTWFSSTTRTGYLQYKFINPVCVKKIKMLAYGAGTSDCRIKTFTVVGSNDGFANDTHTLLDTTTYSQSGSEPKDFELTSFGYYLYYRISVTDTYQTNSEPAIMSLQFYGRELSESVPKMTSNTSPYGEASANAELSSDSAAWKAFMNDPAISKSWAPTNVSGTNPNTGWIQYDFGHRVKLGFVLIFTRSANSWTGFIEGYDGENWEVIHTISDAQTGNNYPSISTSHIYASPVITTKAYTAFRFTSTSFRVGGTGSGYGEPDVNMVQFFGHNYSEYDWDTEHPRHYIYDSGVEVENLGDPIVTGSPIVSKEPNQLYGNTVSGSNGYAFMPENAIDTTNYNLLRCVLGNKMLLNSICGSVGLKSTRGYGSSDYTLLSERQIVSDVMAQPNTVALDISSVNQSCYPIFCDITTGTSRSCSISEMWLE